MEKRPKKAAELGEPKSMNFLGIQKVEGEFLSQDLEEGEKWLRKAIEFGNRVAMFI